MVAENLPLFDCHFLTDSVTLEFFMRLIPSQASSYSHQSDELAGESSFILALPL